MNTLLVKVFYTPYGEKRFTAEGSKIQVQVVAYTKKRFYKQYLVLVTRIVIVLCTAKRNWNSWIRWAFGSELSKKFDYH